MKNDELVMVWKEVFWRNRVIIPTFF